MERLLHYAWKCRMLPLGTLTTTDGREVEVIDPGLVNPHAGPDFFNAKLRIGGVVWAGNVEIHLRSSDWYRHGHQTDEAYNNVVLHVTSDADAEVTTSQGKTLPQLLISVPEAMRTGYEMLLTTMDYPRCYRVVPSLPPMLVHSWMDALLCERLMDRSDRVVQRLEAAGGDWERALLVTLARNFGFSLNGDAFERWARIVPLHACAKHRDDLFQVESLFLGTAGLLNRAGNEAMQREYAYLAHKFQLTEQLAESDWRYLRTRPQNFPHVRLHHLAQLYQRGTVDLSHLVEASGAKQAQRLGIALDVAASLKALHACFALQGLSASSIDLLVINTVVPVLYAYGRQHGEECYEDCAMHLLEHLKGESNYIMRQWKACGLSVSTAADSQALIQLKREYCDRKDCLRCRFGHEFLKKSTQITNL